MRGGATKRIPSFIAPRINLGPRGVAFFPSIPMRIRNTRRIACCLLLSAFAATQGGATFINGAADRRKAYTKGEPTPAMESRVRELVPAAIPPRVRYVFDTNERMNAFAENLRKGLEAGDAALFKDGVMLLPGANKLFGKTLGTGSSNISVSDPADLKNGKFDRGLKMAFLKGEQIPKLATEVSRALKEDGGFVVRALRTDEMAHWWIYIMFDIEEPAFVVASKEGKHRFVVELNAAGQVVVLDELNHLPTH